jgi:hypothetical protein
MVELWVSGPLERPPRVRRRRAAYPQLCAMRWSQSLRLVAVLEPPTGIAGFDDVAVMRQPVEHGCGHLGVAEHVEMPHRLIVESLGSGWLIRTIHCTASAIRPASGARGEGRG